MHGVLRQMRGILQHTDRSKSKARPLFNACRGLDESVPHICLQESHGLPVRQLLFNAEDPSCENLFATVGGEQATVYDDMHMGDYIAVALNYVNRRTAHTAGGVCLLLS